MLVIFVQFCVFVRSCCIGGLRFFLTGIFFDRAFYSNFVFSATLQNFCCRITESNFFRRYVSFSSISFVCVQYPSPNDGVQPLLQALINSYKQLQKRSLLPNSGNHLTSYCCIMLCVSALANLSTPLSRRVTFWYSGHISALMFCASLLRNSQ